MPDTVPRLLVFGATSLVGSHVVADWSGPYEAAGRGPPEGGPTPPERFHSVDLEEPSTIPAVVEASRADVVVNFAARTDVDRLEQERPAAGGQESSGPGWRVNVLAPAAMASACRASGRRFVTFSTDFVFDGSAGPYGETDPPATDPRRVSWYGWTKVEGERRVLSTDPSATILRIAYPFGPRLHPKMDLAHWILERARTGNLPPLYDDQQISPTWIPDVARGLPTIVHRPAPGLLHLASPTLTSPWEFGRRLLRDVRGAAGPEVSSAKLAAVLQGAGATPRPLRGGLRCDRARGLGLSLTPWEDALARIAHPGGAV